MKYGFKGRIQEIKKSSLRASCTFRHIERRSGKAAPQKLSNSTLQKYINWHTQAKEQKINWRKLEQQFLKESNTLHKGVNKGLNFKDGTKLLRHWKGDTYTVITQGNQFIFNNQPYKSLSKIAREITGTNWNGKLFFRVIPKGTSLGAKATNESYSAQSRVRG